MTKSRLVYSTDGGRICPECGQAVARCACARPAARAAGDGVVRVRREVKGRNGKTVTTVSGLPLGDEALRLLAGELKRACGTGGTVKEGVIIVQGDYVEALVRLIKERGYTVKRAGG